MTDRQEKGDIDQGDQTSSRASLVWQVIFLQLKLMVDGLRDVILVPITLVAGLMGLIIGGDHPEKYFQKVLSFGRQSEIWINLFGQRKHDGTSDAMLEPFRARVINETQDIEWLQKAGKGINEKLDFVNQKIESAVVANREERIPNKDIDNRS